MIYRINRFQENSFGKLKFKNFTLKKKNRDVNLIISIESFKLIDFFYI